MTTLAHGPHPLCFGGLMLALDPEFLDYVASVIEREFARTSDRTGNWFLPDTGMCLIAAAREHRAASDGPNALGIGHILRRWRRVDYMTAFPDPITWERSIPGIRWSTLAWAASVRATYGVPLSPDELAMFLQLSGGRMPPEGGTDELLAVVGRRGGKSETIARVATFEALHGGHQVALAPGQIGVVAIVAPLREQAAELLRYVTGLARLPAIARMVESVTSDAVVFKTGIAVQIMTCDTVAVVGRTLVCVVAEEFARWPDDSSATPDRAIVESLRPGLAPIAGAPTRRFVAITSAFIKEGVAYETDRDSFGKDDASTLVVRGTTEAFNPSISQAWLSKERTKNPRAFAREYDAVWQDSIVDGFFGRVLEGAIDRGRVVSPPRPGVVYIAATDPAWSLDSWALAIAHREHRGDKPSVTVIDRVCAWSPGKGNPLSTTDTVAKIVPICRGYGISYIYSDQAAAGPLAEEFQRQELPMIEERWGATGPDSKQIRFRQVLAAMNDGLVRLPDDQATIKEFASMGSRLLRSGVEQLEARGAGHDDRVDACVLAITRAMTLSPSSPGGGGGGANKPTNWGNGGWGYGSDFGNQVF